MLNGLLNGYGLIYMVKKQTIREKHQVGQKSVVKPLQIPLEIILDLVVKGTMKTAQVKIVM